MNGVDHVGHDAVQRVGESNAVDHVPDVVERRTALLRFPELPGEGVVAGWLEGAASAQRAGRCGCVCEAAQMSV